MDNYSTLPAPASIDNPDVRYQSEGCPPAEERNPGCLMGLFGGASFPSDPITLRPWPSPDILQKP